MKENWPGSLEIWNGNKRVGIDGNLKDLMTNLLRKRRRMKKEK